VDVHTSATTVSDAVALTDPTAAEIVVTPSDTPVARPVAETTVATDGVPDIHVAVFVIFAVLASEYVPVAVSCCEIPIPAYGGGGAIEIDSKVAGVIVSVVFPDTDPDVAEMTVEPTAAEVANPEVAFTVAVAGVPEAQLALLVRSVVLPLLNVPVAFSCCVNPFAMIGFDGVIVIDSRRGGDGAALPSPPHEASRTENERYAIRTAQ
jgi:hypothetical protein